ncbi:MAG: flagellar basal body-associated FliL family protein [Bacillota bacterium]
MTQRFSARSAADAPAQQQAGWLSGRRFRLLVLLTIAIGMVAGYFFAAGGGLANIAKRFEKPLVTEIGPIVTLDPFVVNLAGSRGERYLKTTLSLELRSESAVKAVEPLNASMRDAIIGILCSQTLDDLETAGAKQALKTQIVNKLNEVIGSPIVLNVYYQDFVMQ